MVQPGKYTSDEIFLDMLVFNLTAYQDVKLKKEVDDVTKRVTMYV